MKFSNGCLIAAAAVTLAQDVLAFAPPSTSSLPLRQSHASASSSGSSSPSALGVTGQQAESKGPAAFLRKVKADLPQFSWLAEGSGNPNNKIDMPDYVKAVLSQPEAPKREAESEKRTHRIRSRFEEASADAAALRNMLVGEADKEAWWRTPATLPREDGR